MPSRLFPIRFAISGALGACDGKQKPRLTLCHAVVFLSLLLTQGCELIVIASMAYSDPVVLEGSEDKVKFRTGHKVEPGPFAAEYCKEFGKEPVKLSRIADGQLTVVWRYACLPEDPRDGYDAFSPEEMLEIASGLRTSGREGLAKHITCLAAHEGDNQAQARMASFYSLGISGYPKDLEKAYLWSTLAGRYDRVEELSAAMPPDGLERAQRSVFEWKPDQTTCELEETAGLDRE